MTRAGILPNGKKFWSTKDAGVFVLLFVFEFIQVLFSETCPILRDYHAPDDFYLFNSIDIIVVPIFPPSPTSPVNHEELM